MYRHSCGGDSIYNKHMQTELRREAGLCTQAAARVTYKILSPDRCDLLDHVSWGVQVNEPLVDPEKAHTLVQNTLKPQHKAILTVIERPS